MLISKTRRIMYNKTKYKEKKWMNCLQCFSSEEILTNYRKVCLKSSGKQSLNMPEECSNVQKEYIHMNLWMTLNILIAQNYLKKAAIIRR